MNVCTENEPERRNSEYRKNMIQDKLNNMPKESFMMFRHFLEYTEDLEEWKKKNPQCSGAFLTIHEITRYWEICMSSHLDNSNKIANIYGWDFDIKPSDINKLETLCVEPSIPDVSLQEDDFYKGLKEELYSLLFSDEVQTVPELSSYKISWRWNPRFVCCFVKMFWREYELWKIDRVDKLETFRKIEKLSLVYSEIRESFSKDVRFWHYFFLLQFGLFYCVFEGNNLIDYAVYKFGYKELKERVEHKDWLAIYFKKTVGNRKPEMLDSQDLQAESHNGKKNCFEDFIVNKAKSEEIFLLLDKLITDKKCYVFARTLFDYKKSGEIDIRKREFSSFWESFKRKKGSKPCSLQAISVHWTKFNNTE